MDFGLFLVAQVVSGTWAVEADGAPAESFRRLEALDLSRASKDEADYLLEFKDGNWVLSDRHGNKFAINFEGRDYRRASPRGKSELLVRALGGGRERTSVVDLSAGMGVDSVFLSQMGFQVTAVERHPVLGFLLQEARERTSREDVRNIEFVTDDALHFLNERDDFDLIYFDPMYPMKKKSALPRQEMVLFRTLVGDDVDAAQVAARALEKARRLVIKRSLKAEPLLPGPRPVFRGTTVRYDVYVRHE